MSDPVADSAITYAAIGGLVTTFATLFGLYKQSSDRRKADGAANDLRVAKEIKELGDRLAAESEANRKAAEKATDHLEKRLERDITALGATVTREVDSMDGKVQVVHGRINSDAKDRLETERDLGVMEGALETAIGLKLVKGGKK